jgi:hypothetical protein
MLRTPQHDELKHANKLYRDGEWVRSWGRPRHITLIVSKPDLQTENMVKISDYQRIRSSSAG